MDGRPEPRPKKQQKLSTFFVAAAENNSHVESCSTSAATAGSNCAASSDSEHDVSTLTTPDISAALKLRLNSQLTSELKLHFIKSTLKVPPDFKFPFSQTSRRKFYLNYNHISGRNDCFYFSPSLGGVMCLPCVLFAPDKVGHGQSQSTGRLVTEPLKDFNKLTGQDGYLTTHLVRSYHEDAVTKVQALKQTSSSGDIAVKLNYQHAETIKRNRAILRAVIAEIETCGRMNLPLRGHCNSGPIAVPDSEEVINYRDGNLRCLLQKAALKNDLLRQQLSHGPRNASYLSPETQNCLISCIGTVMLRQISNEIKEAKFFAIAADETTDCYKSEQLVMNIRYVDSRSEVCECSV